MNSARNRTRDSILFRSQQTLKTAKPDIPFIIIKNKGKETNDISENTW